jgi:hypothetical protein
LAPSQCINDLAIGKLEVPAYIHEFRPLSWCKGVDRDCRLFLAGLQRQGITKPKKRWVAESMEGAVGGWRYIINMMTHGRLPDYQNAAVLLWRSTDISIRGCSGAMIITPGENRNKEYYREWTSVAFQSHEFSANLMKEEDEGLDFWKVGYQAPEELKREFRPVMGNQQLRHLDLQVAM